MIIDWYHDYSTQDDRPWLYMRTRDANGVLQEQYLSPEDEGWQAPFCWIKKNVEDWKQDIILRRYPMSFIDKTQTATGIDGEPLYKLIVEKPSDLWDIKQDFPKVTYEADVQYVDQVLLSKYPDKIPEFKPRIWYFDLEWDPEEDFTTVMAIDDTHAEHPVVFAWKEDAEKKIQWIDREGGYELHMYNSETSMHGGFLDHLEACDPDILVAHWITGADLPHLMRRLDNPNRLSPLNQVIRLHNKSQYRTIAQPIKGRLIFDTSAPWGDGSGFEGVWYKSGKGQAPSRKLDWWAKELGFGGKLTNEVPEMTVFNGWYEHFDTFVDYCLRDSTLLRQCDEKLHCIDFHLALQRLCGVAFFSTHNVSRYFRGLMGRRTDLKAMSTYAEDREKLEAAWVMPPVAGRHEGVALVDFASLYPNIILSNNLCWTTQRDGPGVDILSLDNGTHWDQSKQGLLPSVVEEMLELRKEYKKLYREATDVDKKLGYHMLQMATKVSVNAIYGMCGIRRLGGGWSGYDIARSITYKGRESIRILISESEKLGYRALAGHTDSAYIQVPFDKAVDLADHLTKVSQDELGMSHLDVELEAYFPYWFTGVTKNRNFGIKSYPESEKGEMKVTGFEIKAANAAPITKEIQRIAFNLISTGADEDAVRDSIRPIVKELHKGERPTSDITIHTRIKKDYDDYEKPSAASRAAHYYNTYTNPNDPIRKGNTVQYVYVDGVPEGQPMIAYGAYKDEKELKDFSIDWSTIVEKFVTAKLKLVYKTLEWDLDSIVKKQVPKIYW